MYSTQLVVLWWPQTLELGSKAQRFLEHFEKLAEVCLLLNDGLKMNKNYGTLMVPETSQKGGFRNTTNQIMLRNMALTLALATVLTLTRWLWQLTQGFGFGSSSSSRSVVPSHLFFIISHHFLPIRSNVRRRECINCKMCPWPWVNSMVWLI